MHALEEVSLIGMTFGQLVKDQTSRRVSWRPFIKFSESSLILEMIHLCIRPADVHIFQYIAYNMHELLGRIYVRPKCLIKK